MKRIIAIIFLIVISFGLGEKNEFVPDEAFFQQVVKKYDTDVNLSQYRFRFYEKKPNVNNAAEFYDYEYELDVSKQNKLLPQVKELEEGLKECYEWYIKNQNEVRNSHAIY